MSKRRFLLPCLLLVALAGCRGVPLRIPTTPVGPDEAAGGTVTGECTGVMLFGFIPINQNERFNDAYSMAVASEPGTTRLTDITIQEDWFWAWVLNGYQFKLTGTAVHRR